MGGGGAKSRLCATHYPLNPNLSLYILLFTFLTFLSFKFLVIVSEYIARVRQAIIFFIDFHAKNRSRSFLFAMTGKTANALPCHTEALCRSIHRKITLLNSIFGYFACAQYDKFRLLLKNNGYFHSNFKAKIQIFHSKFKAFCKFNSFHKFISNFKPYTRLFYIFTPNFRSVFTDKFCTRS